MRQLLLATAAVMALVGCHKAKPAPIQPAQPKHHVIGAYDGCTDCSQLAKDIAWSLDNQPSLWTGDSGIIRHKDYSIVIWTAFGKDNLRVSADISGPEWTPSSDDQGLIYRATQRWRKQELPHLRKSLASHL